MGAFPCASVSCFYDRKPVTFRGRQTAFRAFDRGTNLFSPMKIYSIPLTDSPSPGPPGPRWGAARLKALILCISAVFTCPFPPGCLGQGGPPPGESITFEEIGVNEGIKDRASGDYDGDGIDEYLATSGQ